MDLGLKDKVVVCMSSASGFGKGIATEFAREGAKVVICTSEAFKAELDQAEKDLDGERIKVPDELSDEVCDVCGKQMVIKSGRFGRFLACPGYPECTFTKPLVIEMPGKCPKCGSRILKKTSRNGYTYYGCEHNPQCPFMTWDKPVEEKCPSCGSTLFQKAGRGGKLHCLKEGCGDEKE